jgi:hypothetical protein
MKNPLYIPLIIFIMLFAGCSTGMPSGGRGMSGYPNEAQKQQKAFEKDLDKKIKQAKEP